MIRLWKALLSSKILSKELTDDFLTAHICKSSTDKNDCAGYGNFMYLNDNFKTRYIIGCDAGVSFKSCFNEKHNVQYTVLSNTTEGAWPMIRLIDEALA